MDVLGTAARVALAGVQHGAEEEGVNELPLA